ncbi:hypothetical protein HU200_024946 [Digitaria exilis]|uniref:Uncharacterized protein n=1 Tax=Digitaria exilis TaxID=1010633 RepID=A0A835C089_9POAL|nr:hypothetical protein HU200_024946 [Digitaria exilis]
MDPHPTPYPDACREAPAGCRARARAAGVVEGGGAQTQVHCHDARGEDGQEVADRQHQLRPTTTASFRCPSIDSDLFLRALRFVSFAEVPLGVFSRPPRRAFGTTKSNNAPVEKPPPPLQKPSKVSPPLPKKPSKMSPPAMQKPSRLPPTTIQKPSKQSPPAVRKPSKLSPPNPIKVTKPSRLAGKPLKKVAPGADVEAKIKKSQRVSFQEAEVGASAPRSGEKVKDYADDAVGHTPMVAIRVTEKPAKVLTAETPFFSAQNCSNCTLDQFESATYWLAQIRMAESIGKHWVAAAFFRLAFECQAQSFFREQPIHRIRSELRSYVVRHESAGTFTPLFDELLTAHGMPVKQPKFDADGCDNVDTPLATNAVEKDLDTATLKVDECLEFDCGEDLIDVGAIIVNKHDEDTNVMDQLSIQKKLNESFEFDDSEAVIVDQVDEANFDLSKNMCIEVPCSDDIVQSACRPSTEKLSPRVAIVVSDSSSRRLSLVNPSDKLSPNTRSSSSRRLSSGSSFDRKSPLSSKRLISSCPPCKKSSTRDLSSKRIPYSSHSDGKHSVAAGVAYHKCEVYQEVALECPALFDQLESKEPADDAASNEDLGVCAASTF